MFAQFLGSPQCHHHDVEISFVGEIGGVDQQRVGGIGSGEPDGTAADRAQEREHHREARFLAECPTRAESGRRETELNVGLCGAIAAQQHVWHPVRHRQRLGRRVTDPADQVVVQVLADTGNIGNDVNPVVAQMCRRSNTRAHQQLRRPYRPRANDDLALDLDVVGVRPPARHVTTLATTDLD